MTPYIKICFLQLKKFLLLWILLLWVHSILQTVSTGLKICKLIDIFYHYGLMWQANICVKYLDILSGTVCWQLLSHFSAMTTFILVSWSMLHNKIFFNINFFLCQFPCNLKPIYYFESFSFSTARLILTRIVDRIFFYSPICLV